MKKLFIAGLLISTSCFTASQAFTTTFATANPGDELTITSTTTNPNLDFTPSPKVSVSGATGDSQYRIAAGHLSTINKDEAKAYGLSSDNSQMYWKIYDNADDVTRVNTFNYAFSTAAGDDNWKIF